MFKRRCYGPTDGRTDPLTEMRRRILKQNRGVGIKEQKEEEEDDDDEDEEEEEGQFRP